ncbi:hypothetical protein [Streptomyces tailanensis]|uniref:hypothetical protein n=1 Tax=Streptomyces tailanensis TaxID=2569858 RepID=UPI00122E79E4
MHPDTWRQRLYRLGALTPLEPFPEGRGRVAGEQDRERLHPGPSPASPSGGVMFWGAPVPMAGMAPIVAGQIRVAPAHTPAHFRGRGYAAAVTAEVSRATRAARAVRVLGRRASRPGLRRSPDREDQAVVADR